MDPIVHGVAKSWARLATFTHSLTQGGHGLTLRMWLWRWTYPPANHSPLSSFWNQSWNVKQILRLQKLFLAGLQKQNSSKKAYQLHFCFCSKAPDRGLKGPLFWPPDTAAPQGLAFGWTLYSPGKEGQFARSRRGRGRHATRPEQSLSLWGFWRSTRSRAAPENSYSCFCFWNFCKKKKFVVPGEPGFGMQAQGLWVRLGRDVIFSLRNRIWFLDLFLLSWCLAGFLGGWSAWVHLQRAGGLALAPPGKSVCQGRGFGCQARSIFKAELCVKTPSDR